MRFYRTLCNFTAYSGAVQVHGRVHFELAENEQDASRKTEDYLKTCGYDDVEIVECHVETEAEKYQKESSPAPVIQERAEAPKVESSDGELW